MFLSSRQLLSHKLRTKITDMSCRRVRTVVTNKSVSRTFQSNQKVLTKSHFQHTRTFLTGRRLRNLEAEANRSPSSSASQAAYLRELNKVKPAEVLRRVDSGAFASDEVVVKEYLKALVATGRIDQANLSNISGAQQQHQYNQGSGMFGQMGQQQAYNGSQSGIFGSSGMMNGGGFGSMGGGAAAAASGMNASAAPVMVKLVQPDAKSQFLSFLRSVMPTALILAGTYYIFSSAMPSMGGKSGAGKGGGGMFGMIAAHELKPQTSDKTFDDVKGCDEAKAELQEIAGKSDHFFFLVVFLLFYLYLTNLNIL